METYIVTIPITTDMDSAQLLEILNTQIAQMIVDEIESYGYEVEVDENDITVENVDDQITCQSTTTPAPLTLSLLGARSFRAADLI